MARDWRDDRIAEQAATIAEQGATIAKLTAQVEALLARVTKLGKPSAKGVFFVSLFPRMRVVGGGDGTEVTNEGGTGSLDAVA